MTAFSTARRWTVRIAVVAAAAVATLFMADLVARAVKPDVPLLKGFLYRQVADHEAHQYDPNPDILFRLRPGRYEFSSHTVTVNQQGARGPDRPAAKTPGTFRVITLGGSNVYGSKLNDGETWPARLETRLNELTGRPVEVWNFGVSGYVGVQMAALGREMVEKLDPDLVILALSNVGPKAILWEPDISSADFLAKHRWIWPAMRRAENPDVARAAGSVWKQRLFENSPLYRFLALRYLRTKNVENLSTAVHPDSINIKAVHRFAEETRRRTRLCYFICPGAAPGPLSIYFVKGIPTFVLSSQASRGDDGVIDSLVRIGYPITETHPAADLPGPYGEIHPPAEVMEWYAEALAAWLDAQNPVPGAHPLTERSAQGRWVIRFIVVVAAASATLLGAEMYVRVAAPDAPLLQGLLYFAVGDRPSHQYDPDPDLLYRLKPGRAEYQTHIVTINEHGARGPDRTAAKPPGTFRIFVLGGSNVYGAVLNDDETWPAQLEARLNETTGPPVEVWNFGVSAYVGVQMAALGREVTERLNPDLVIVALSNSGQKAIFEEPGISFTDLIAKHPWIWPAMRHTDDASVTRIAGSPVKEKLLAHSRLYRYLALRYLRTKGIENLSALLNPEDRNVEAIRRYIDWATTRTKACLFVCPAVSPQWLTPYIESKLPTFILRARATEDDEGAYAYYESMGFPVTVSRPSEDLDEVYAQIHPPPSVMTWYAEKIAAWLRSSGLVPDQGAE